MYIYRCKAIVESNKEIFNFQTVWFLFYNDGFLFLLPGLSDISGTLTIHRKYKRAITNIYLTALQIKMNKILNHENQDCHFINIKIVR